MANRKPTFVLTAIAMALAIGAVIIVIADVARGASLTINDPYLCTSAEPCSGPIIMHEDAVSRANREFRERQDRIRREDGNPTQRATEEFRDRQHRIYCADHPGHC